jgi:hypothetical protein
MHLPESPRPSSGLEEQPFVLESVPEKLWTLEQVAAELSVSSPTVWEWVRGGWLPGPVLVRRRRPLWDPRMLERFRRRRPAGEGRY